MATSITYNSYNLQYEDPTGQSTILTRDILHRQMGDKNIILREDSIRDSFKVVDVKYSRKTITVRGWLISNSEANLRTLRDAFMNNLKVDESNLDIGYGSGTIRYKASVQSINMPEEFWHITQIPFEIEFLAEPFGKATTTTTINLNSGGAITSSPYNENISITGTYNTKPVITITVNSETSMTIFRLSNSTTGDWIQVAPSGGFSTDVLEIDCENETVKLNDSSIDFTGVFPAFQSGTNSLTLTITATAFNLNASVVYYPTYL